MVICTRYNAALWWRLAHVLSSGPRPRGAVTWLSALAHLCQPCRRQAFPAQSESAALQVGGQPAHQARRRGPGHLGPGRAGGLPLPMFAVKWLALPPPLQPSFRCPARVGLPSHKTRDKSNDPEVTFQEECSTINHFLLTRPT